MSNLYSDFTTYGDNKTNKHRISQKEKDADDFKWYKSMADLLDSQSFSGNQFAGFAGITEYKRKKVNYDLFNNIIDQRDFEYVCTPFGAEAGDLPANFTNRDIVSGKLKVLLGLEMKMPFSWRAIAVNEEATTRKEQEETSRIKNFVTSEIMRPIKQQIESQTMAQQKGRELTPEEQQQLQQQIAEETKAQTPDEVRRYMTREHQDPAEILAHQLLEYLILEQQTAFKFNKGFKHTLLSGEEVYYVGIINGKPHMSVVNALRFDYDRSPESDFIEDADWQVYELRMTPANIVATFGSELTNEEIDRIYSKAFGSPSHVSAADFTFDNSGNNDAHTLRVLHTAFKSLKKIGFLTYYDRNQKVQLKLVDENYKLNKLEGDIDIEWDWIPEAHETYKILDDIYVYCRPVPGQYKDIDNLYTCKMPYYGAACDSLNSAITSPMDRVKAYQYYYDIVLYRIELLMASDKGKILAANINAIPKSAGIDIHKFQYFMEANKMAWFNPNEEGMKGQSTDVTNLVKEIDMSLVSDIFKYIQVAEYIEKKCGDAIGVTKQMEGAIGPDEAVTNTKQNIVQSSHIIQPYFELHNIVKGNVLTALLEKAKVAYSQSKPRVLSYVLDDMSYKMLTINPELLDSSTYGLFISNSSKASDAKKAVENLSQAAMQNQQADLGDIIKVIRSESVNEAEELLEAARIRKAEEAQSADMARIKHEKEVEQLRQGDLIAARKHEKEMIVLKETERRATEIEKQKILSLGFAEDKDVDDNEVPDVLEVAKFGADRGIRERKQGLDEEKFTHQQKVDKEKLRLEAEKIKNQKNKPVSK